MQTERFRRAARVLLLAAALLPARRAAAQKMITFESRPVAPHHKIEECRNSLTVGIGSAFAGYTSVYYDRAITPFLSIQGGAGITYRSLMNDIGQMVYDLEPRTGYFNGGLYEDIDDNYASYRYRKAGMGQYFSLSPRFYVRDWALDGAYIGPMIEYKMFRYQAQKADESAPVSNWEHYDDEKVPRAGGSVKEHMRCLDLTCQVGGHLQTRRHVVIGFSFGVGVRSLTAERLDIGTVRDDYDIDSEAHFRNAMRKYDSIRPLFVFNFIMGGCF